MSIQSNYHTALTYANTVKNACGGLKSSGAISYDTSSTIQGNVDAAACINDAAVLRKQMIELMDSASQSIQNIAKAFADTDQQIACGVENDHK